MFGRTGHVGRIDAIRKNLENFSFLSALPYGFVFTRNSTATYTDASGATQTAAVDEPRFDHDPVTHEPLGMILDPAAGERLTLTLPAYGFPGADSFTVAVEFSPMSLPGNGAVFGVSSVDGAADVTFAALTTGGKAKAVKNIAGFSVASSDTVATVVVDAVSRLALTINAADARMSLDGGVVVAATNTGYPTMVQLTIGGAL